MLKFRATIGSIFNHIISYQTFKHKCKFKTKPNFKQVYAKLAARKNTKQQRRI